jgi:phosphoribosylformylglycinamidine synthase
MAEALGVPTTTIGATGGSTLEVEGWFDVPLAELRAAWTGTLPAALG